MDEERRDPVRATRQLRSGRLRSEAYFDRVVTVHALQRVWSFVVTSLAALLHHRALVFGRLVHSLFGRSA